MSKVVGAGRQVIDGQSAAPSYTTNFKPAAVSAQNLNKLIRLFVANDTPANVAAFFENRASVNTIRSWRNGNRYIAPWARQIIRNKIAAAKEAIDDLPTGPGMKAGWRNVAGYTANR